MSRDAFLQSLVKISNEEYNLPFKFVKRKCNKDNKDNQDELPNNITY